MSSLAGFGLSTLQVQVATARYSGSGKEGGGNGCGGESKAEVDLGVEQANLKVGDRSRPVSFTRSLAEDLRVAPELTPSSMRMPFDLRFYRKKRAVQLKPAEDAQVHFSLAWGRKEELSVHDMDDIHGQIVRYLEQHDWKLSFVLAIARGSCTYGRFDEGFEDLLFALRGKYPPLCTKKNLAWEDHLGEMDPEPRPYAFHITHWSQALPEFAAFLKSARPRCGKTLHLDVSVR